MTGAILAAGYLWISWYNCLLDQSQECISILKCIPWIQWSIFSKIPKIHSSWLRHQGMLWDVCYEHHKVKSVMVRVVLRSNNEKNLAIILSEFFMFSFYPRNNCIKNIKICTYPELKLNLVFWLTNLCLINQLKESLEQFEHLMSQLYTYNILCIIEQLL